MASWNLNPLSPRRNPAWECALLLELCDGHDAGNRFLDHVDDRGFDRTPCWLLFTRSCPRGYAAAARTPGYGRKPRHSHRGEHHQAAGVGARVIVTFGVGLLWVVAILTQYFITRLDRF